MRVVIWTVIWLALVGGAAWVLWRAVRRLWRRAGELTDALDEATGLAEQTSQQVREELARRGAQAGPADELAVFRHPLDVALERHDLRETLAQERASRRAASRPGWARRLDSTQASTPDVAAERADR